MLDDGGFNMAPIFLAAAAPLCMLPPHAPTLLLQSAVPLDGSQSLLAFEGGLRVHGLFDFLLNESFRSHGDECDVPTLLAPVQFAHASLRAFQPRVRRRWACCACACLGIGGDKLACCWDGVGAALTCGGCVTRQTHIGLSCQCCHSHGQAGFSSPSVHCWVSRPACSSSPQVLGRSDARAGSGPTASRTLHRLELRAPALPPWVLDRLAAVLTVTQVGAGWLCGAVCYLVGLSAGCVAGGQSED